MAYISLPFLVLAGFVSGYFFTSEVNIIISAAVAILGGSLLWQTRNAELGSLIGILAAVAAAVFIAAQWVTILVFYGNAYPVLEHIFR